MGRAVWSRFCASLSTSEVTDACWEGMASIIGALYSHCSRVTLLS